MYSTNRRRKRSKSKRQYFQRRIRKGQGCGHPGKRWPTLARLEKKL